LKRYYPSIKRFFWTVPVCLLIGLLAGFSLGKALPVTYIASATMFVDVNAPDTYIPGQTAPASDSLVRATNYAAEIPSRLYMTYIYNSDPLIKQRGYTVDDLMADVAASPSVTTASLLIVATTSNPADSVLLANDTAKGVQGYVQTQLQTQLNAQRAALQAQITAAQNQRTADANKILAYNNSALPQVGLLNIDIQDMIHNIDAANSTLQALPTTMHSDIYVTGLASPETVANSSRTSSLVEQGGSIGLAVGLLLMLILIFADERLRGEDQVRDKLGLAYIGGMFNKREIRSGQVPTSGVSAQQFADIAVNLHLTNVLSGPWRTPQGAVLLVTSARPGEGKTTLATGLAASVARGGRSVLVIDANLRNPGTHLALGMSPGSFGLSGLLKANGAENIDAAVQRSKLPGVWLMPAGAATDDGALLIEQKLPGILAQLRNRTDLIIIDGPALLISAEASIIASSVDGVAMVIDARKDKLKVLLRAKDVLHSLAQAPAGVILNRLPRQKRNAYYVTAYPAHNAKTLSPSSNFVVGNGHKGNSGSNGNGSNGLVNDNAGTMTRGPQSSPLFFPAASVPPSPGRMISSTRNMQPDPGMMPMPMDLPTMQPNPPSPFPTTRRGDMMPPQP
jgi:tyrosine-protein kinase